jgi:hypothetical protein
MSSDIIESKLVVVNWNVCNNGVVNPILNIPINNLSFQPDMYRIELLTCSNSNVNDNLFVVTSNLSEFQPLVSYTGRTTFGINLSQQGVMSQPLIQLSFQLQMIAPDPASTIYSAGGLTVSGGNTVLVANGQTLTYNNTIAGPTNVTYNFYPQNGGANPTNAYVSMSISFFKLKSGKKNTFTV